MVSKLFTECQNSTQFQRYDQFNFWGLAFYIGNRRVIFGDFFTIFAYKDANHVTMMQAMDFNKKNLEEIFLKILLEYWANFAI